MWVSWGLPILDKNWSSSFKVVDFFPSCLSIPVSRHNGGPCILKCLCLDGNFCYGRISPEEDGNPFPAIVHLLFLLFLETLQGEPCWDLQTKSLSEWGLPRRASGSTSYNRCSSWRCEKKSETYSYSHKVSCCCLVGGWKGRWEERNPYRRDRREPGKHWLVLFCFVCRIFFH